MKTVKIWSKKIVSVLSFYKNNSQNYLFGITGDIDNLGIFVAQNGRASAENLVDVYNRLVGAFFYNFFNTHLDIRVFCLIPSGEEIFILGVADNQKVISKLFQTTSREINKFIKINMPTVLRNQKTAISFGCAILNNLIKIKNIKSLLKLIECGDEKKASLVYLKIMYDIRTELSHGLDKNKFTTLGANSVNEVILLRNLVYFHLLKYKKETRATLKSFSKIFKWNKNTMSIANRGKINKTYGLKGKSKKYIISRLLSFIKKQPTS